MKEDEILNSHVGTPIFDAPEILKKENYNVKSDMWSLGVILYNLLTGKYPYNGRSKEELIRNLNDKNYNIPENLSNKCFKLLNGLLEQDPHRRFSHNDFFNSSFITGIDSFDSEYTSSSLTESMEKTLFYYSAQRFDVPKLYIKFGLDIIRRSNATSLASYLKYILTSN